MQECLAGFIEGLDSFGFAPTVAFTLVAVVLVGYIAAVQRGDDFLRLGRGNDIVFPRYMFAASGRGPRSESR